jgi:hypothetical protein
MRARCSRVVEAKQEAAGQESATAPWEVGLGGAAVV